MKRTELKVTYRQTINLGDYESVSPDVGVVFTLEDGDSLQECAAAALQDLTESHRTLARTLLERATARRQYLAQARQAYPEADRAAILAEYYRQGGV